MELIKDINDVKARAVDDYSPLFEALEEDAGHVGPPPELLAKIRASIAKEVELMKRPKPSGKFGVETTNMRNKKKAQREIDRQNQLLFRRIQVGALRSPALPKPCASNLIAST